MATKKLFTNPNRQPGGTPAGKPGHSGNCKQSRLTCLTDEELSRSEAEVLRKHLAGCEACRTERESVLSMRKMILDEISAETAGLTGWNENIAAGLNLQNDVPPKPLTVKSLLVARWISAIAAGLLVLIFIGEQARSVQKISALEERMAAIDYSDTPGIIDQWTIYRSGSILAGLTGLPGVADISRVSLNPFNIQEIRKVKQIYDDQIKRHLINRQSGFKIQTGEPTNNRIDKTRKNKTNNNEDIN